MALTISALFFCNHLWHLLCTFLCAEVFYISLSGSFIPTCIYGFPTFDLNFYIFFLGAIHKLHSSHHNGNEYTMAWVEVLPEGTFLLLIICYAAAISTRYFLNFHTKFQKIFLVSSISSKKRTKTSLIVVKLNLFVRFLEETSAWKIISILSDL